MLSISNERVRIPTKLHQETRALNKACELEASPEAAREHERLVLANTFISKEISRLVGSRNIAQGKTKETLTQKISELQSVNLIPCARAR